ncbi:MAG TPA: hypothetical protein VLG50_04245 [Candidatus Saccharimonadales bacterium]|nr:hypothetical protein [Candidatus Saccharimonadales bacterium]
MIASDEFSDRAAADFTRKTFIDLFLWQSYLFESLRAEYDAAIAQAAQSRKNMCRYLEILHADKVIKHEKDMWFNHLESLYDTMYDTRELNARIAIVHAIHQYQQKFIRVLKRRKKILEQRFFTRIAARRRTRESSEEVDSLTQQTTIIPNSDSDISNITQSTIPIDHQDPFSSHNSSLSFMSSSSSQTSTSSLSSSQHLISSSSSRDSSPQSLTYSEYG